MHEDQHVVIFTDCSGDYQVYHVDKAMPAERHKLKELEQLADDEFGFLTLRDYVKHLKWTQYPAAGFFEYGSAAVSLYVNHICVRAQNGDSSLVRCQTPAHAQQLFPLVLERLRSVNSGVALDSHSRGMMQILGRSFSGRAFNIRLCVDSKIP